MSASPGSTRSASTSRTPVGARFSNRERILRMHFFRIFIITTAISAGLLAQESPAPPIQAKRLPPEKSKRKAPTGNDTLLDRYDFGAQINALQDTNALPSGAQTVNPTFASSPTSPNSEPGVPVGFRLKTDVQLTETAQEAVQMSEKWMSEH